MAMKKDVKFKIAITGATGFVGKNVTNYLKNQNVATIKIIRKNGRSSKFCRTLFSTNLKENYLVRDLKGCTALLHFIGTGKQTVENDYEKVNFNLTKNAISLCKKAGIKKLIYISGLGVQNNTTSGYFISKYKAEKEIIKSGLNYTIFRASYIIGKHDPLSQILIKQIKRGKIEIPGSGDYKLQPIFVEDVSKIIFQAIVDKKFSNKIFDLVGPDIVTFNQLLKKFLGKKLIKIQKIDFEIACKIALKQRKYFFGIDDLILLVGSYTGNNKKLIKLLNFKLKPFGFALKTSRLLQ